jgi:hypothetical protein
MVFLQELQCFSIHFTEAILHKGEVPDPENSEKKAVFLLTAKSIRMLYNLLDLVASNIHDSLTRATRNLPFACMEYFATVVFLTHENAER